LCNVWSKPWVAPSGLENQVVRPNYSNTHNRFVSPESPQVLADEQLAPVTGGGYDLTSPGNVVWTLADNEDTIRDLAVYNAQTGLTTVANHRIYDPFGKLVSQTNPATGNAAAVDCLFGYTGCATDSNTDIEFHERRVKISGSPDWMSVDPISLTSGVTNLDDYCGNDPVNATDPTGEAWWNLWICDLGYSLGDRIGTGYAALFGKGFDLELQSAALRQERAVREMSSANSQMTAKEFADERLSVLQRGLGEALNTAFRIADGALAAGELTVAVVSVVVDGAAALEAAEGLTGRNVIQALGNEIKQFLGDDSRMIVNEAGDKIFVSQNGLRRVQFHFNKTFPHDSPHVHIDVKVGGTWKNTRFYPKDVPPH
jgi:RHS repeat-associated protein